MTTTTLPDVQTPTGALDALRNHWPEYLMEAACLGLFMISACVFSVLLSHPSSALNQAIDSPVLRRMIGGLAMGMTAVAIMFSPWGQRSGAHMNPAVTLTFLRLGKVARWDAAFYIAAQFTGGIAGVAVASLAIGVPLRHAEVNYAVTQPGTAGVALAFAAEFLISFVLMSVVLRVANSGQLSRYTPFFAGTMVALYIALESPLSGMSMNPARTFGSAFLAQEWQALWIYFTAPPLAMLLAGHLYQSQGKGRRVFCAKFHHHNNQRCIFHCNFDEMR